MTIRKLFEFTAIVFISVTVISLSKASRPDVSDTYASTLRLSSFTTIVACLHYFLMALSSVFQKDTLAIIMYRYADWVITTPILLIELLVLLGISGDPWYITQLVFANLVMLVFGFYGEIFTDVSSKIWGGILGFVPLLYIVWRVYSKFIDQHGDTNQSQIEKTELYSWRSILGIGFAIIWGLYGIVYFFDSNYTRSILYTILDLISKGVFAAIVYGGGKFLIGE
jgi:bacteriorhodopsin